MTENFLARLFEHNNWANEKIMEICLTLTDEQLDAPPQSATEGNIRSTLSHLVSAQFGYLPFTTFLASFVNKNAEWKLTKFDLACGVLSLIGLVLWLITKVGNIAIAFSILADALAAIPTIVKAYKYPDTEIAWPWIATSIGVILTLLTLDTLSFENSGFIIYILIVDTFIFVLVKFRIGEKLS